MQRELPVASARFLAAQLHELAYSSAAVHGGQLRTDRDIILLTHIA